MSLLTVDEVTKRLNVSLSTVNRWIRDGELTPVDLNAGQKGRRLLRFRESDIEAFVARGESSPQHRRQMPRPTRKRTTKQYL